MPNKNISAQNIEIGLNKNLILTGGRFIIARRHVVECFLMKHRFLSFVYLLLVPCGLVPCGLVLIIFHFLSIPRYTLRCTSRTIFYSDTRNFSCRALNGFLSRLARAKKASLEKLDRKPGIPDSNDVNLMYYDFEMMSFV